MYQNRMRHKDYIKIINELGFEILDEVVNYPNENEFEQLKNVEVDDLFKKNYSLEELSIKSSILVLRKN